MRNIVDHERGLTAYDRCGRRAGVGPPFLAAPSPSRRSRLGERYAIVDPATGAVRLTATRGVIRARFTMSPQDGGRVALRVCTGKHLADLTGKLQTLDDAATRIGVEHLEGSVVRLRSWLGYWMAYEGGGKDLHAGSSNPDGHWERFTVVHLSEHHLALQISNRTNFVSTDPGVAMYNALPTKAGVWEAFGPIARDVAALKLARALRWPTSARVALLWTGDGKMVQAANGGGGGLVTVSRDAPGAWETFTLEYLGDDTCRLKASNGRYLIVEAERVFAYSSNPGEWERFTLNWNRDRWATLRA